MSGQLAHLRSSVTARLAWFTSVCSMSDLCATGNVTALLSSSRYLLQVTTDIGTEHKDGPVLRISGSSLDFAGYLAAVRDEEDLELSSIPTTSGRPLQVIAASGHALLTKQDD